MNKKVYTRVLKNIKLLTAVYCLCSSLNSMALELTNNSHTDFVIYHRKDAAETVKTAAAELQHYLEKVSGAAVKITNNPPGDKFISQTSVILASFAQGKTQIKGFLMHGECTKIVDALATLGVIIERYTPDILIVHGRLGNNLKEPSSIIDMDDSEVGLKLIIGILSAQPFFSVVCGNEYLCRQSIKNIIASLTQLGATIFGRQNNVYPPVAIKGGHLHTTDFDFYKLDPYAKSTILLAALSGNVSIKIKESVGSWDHTERMIQQFGGDIQKENNKIILGNNNKLLATDIIIPGDFFLLPC
jgi:3-phosphoshikimate 1-carboxyvinyltransferase